MVTIDRIMSSYSVFELNSLYYGMCNKCGGSNANPNSDLATVLQDVDGKLQPSGGSVFLKDLAKPAGYSPSSNVLLMESYQGRMTYYRDNSKLGEIADPVASTVSGTFEHQNNTTEQDLIVFQISNPTVIHELTLDLSSLTKNATIRVYKKLGGNWRRLFGRTLDWTPAMDDGVPFGDIRSVTDVKVTIQSPEAEGAVRSIPYSGWKEAWS